MVNGPAENHRTDVPGVVLFAYNRPDLLQSVLEALHRQTVRPQKIMAFVDGPKDTQDTQFVCQCIQLLQNDPVYTIDITARENHVGCNGNILDGLHTAIQAFTAFMVLEDDVCPSPPYYETLCTLLNHYADDHQIFSVRTYACPESEQISEYLQEDLFFTNRFNPCGYGTWSDRWSDELLSVLAHKNYNPFGRFYDIPLYRSLYQLIPYEYRRELLHPDEWAMSLIWYTLYNQYLHVCTRLSMIHNIGFGHVKATTTVHPSDMYNRLYNEQFIPKRFPSHMTLYPGLAAPLTLKESFSALFFIIKRSIRIKLKTIIPFI